ncbi:MAG: zinc ribbon domain-containing protein [Bacteroidota bacterium]
MPTYVYRREDGTTFEVFQRITDDALETDPETGQAVERVIGGGAGLIFKGSGFYETDYVRKSGTPESKGEKKSESASESKAEGSSEAKSDTKPASKPASGD